MGALETLRRRERTIARARWAAAGLLAAQVAVGMAPATRAALLVAALLVVVGLVELLVGPRLQTVDAGRRLAVVLMGADSVAVAGYVWAGAAAGTGLAWGAVVLLCLEGALRRRFVGGVVTSGGAAVGYLLIEAVAGTAAIAEVLGSAAVLVLIGTFGGAIARELDVERLLYQRMADASQDIAGQQDEPAILASFARVVWESVPARSAMVLSRRDGHWVQRMVSPDRSDLGPAEPASPAAAAEAATPVVWRPASGGAPATLTLPITLAGRPAEHLLRVDVAGPRPRGLTEGALTSLAEATAGALATLEAIQHQRASNRRLRRLEALRTRFVATVAHDLRSPLTTVKGVAAILRERRDAVPPDRLDAMLDSVSRQADRLNRLADDLLDAARLDTDQLHLALAEVDLAPILHAVAADADEEVTVLASGDLRVRADAPRIERVVWNLVSNAAKHGRGPIVVTAHPDPATAVVQLEVRDHGPGLGRAQRARLFDDFAAGDDPDSVGLGLAIVWQLVTAHGGTVSYHDADPGACFAVTLPVTGPPATDPDPASTVSNPPAVEAHR